MTVCEALPPLHGDATHEGSLADFIWFRTGGPAEWLVRPRDVDDLASFVAGLDPSTPVLPVGVGSNLIVRDGGVPGVVVPLESGPPPPVVPELAICPLSTKLKALFDAFNWSSVLNSQSDVPGMFSCPGICSRVSIRKSV